jgi:predicted HTH transcriptional regulator
MIQSVALLRQYQEAKKNSRGSVYIQADQEDYNITYQLLHPVMSRMYATLDQKSAELLSKVIEETKNEEIGVENEYKDFTNQDCQEWTGTSEATIRRRLAPLVWKGIVNVNKENKPYQYQVVKPELAKSTDVGLPHPDELADDTEKEVF